MPIRATIEPQKNTESQRAAARIGMRIAASGSIGSGEQSAVLIHNLSATGMLIETTADLTIDQRIILDLPEAPSQAATVVWRSEALAGCRFDTALSRATLSALQLRNPLPADVDPATDAPGEPMPHRLRRLRLERGLSRSALSALTGVSAPSIWAWETGKTAPRRRSLTVLAAALGLTWDELVGSRDAIAAGESEASAGNAGKLKSLVADSREQIAAMAGVKAANVKISIDL